MPESHKRGQARASQTIAAPENGSVSSCLFDARHRRACYAPRRSHSKRRHARCGPCAELWGKIKTPTRVLGLEMTERDGQRDRKSTRLNSSHEWISYAVFCL